MQKEEWCTRGMHFSHFKMFSCFFISYHADINGASLITMNVPINGIPIKNKQWNKRKKLPMIIILINRVETIFKIKIFSVTMKWNSFIILIFYLFVDLSMSNDRRCNDISLIGNIQVQIRKLLVQFLEWQINSPI